MCLEQAQHTCRYQGESDAIPERVVSFKDASEMVLQSLRTALDAPTLPVVQVAITCNSSKTPLSDRINALQRQMALPRLATVDAAGLELQQDGVHLTMTAQEELASKLVAAYLQLANSAPPSNASLSDYQSCPALERRINTE
jgi:hypothetical protein